MQQIGLIGLQWGRNYIRNINLLPEKAQVVAVCARNKFSYENLKEKPNNPHVFYNNAYDLINSDVDVVICAVNPNIQKDLAVYALDCNRHIILEKPLALKYQDALEIQQVAERTKKNIIVNYTDLWAEKYKECYNFAITSSAPTFIKCDYGGMGPFRDDYSALFDWASHPVALALNYQNNELLTWYEILWCPCGKTIRDGNYVINLKWNNCECWINTGNMFFDQKVRRFAVYNELCGSCTYEQFKTEHREQKYVENCMLNMLTEYIDKLEKKEYFTNLPLAVRTTELLERLEREL